MATNPLMQSPFDKLAEDLNAEANAPLPGQQAAAPVTAMPDVQAAAAPETSTAAPAAAPNEGRRPSKAKTDFLPPAELRPLFDSAAQKHNVPANVLMALGHQESRFNSKAIGDETQWGRAKGMLQYLDETAKGMGINPFDAGQSIDAAAKQIRERLDKGYSMEDAVKEHFAGPDRKKWGAKTAAYGREVMDKTFKIGGMLEGQPVAERADKAEPVPADWKQLTPKQVAEIEAQRANGMSPAMPRAVYEQTLRANSPNASPGLIASAMEAFDKNKAAQTIPAAKGVLPPPTPEQFFQEKLDARLAGPRNGIVPQLPGQMQTTPEVAAGLAPSGTGSQLGQSLKAGGYDLLGGAATILDSVNPFTLSRADAAVLFKDDPAKLKEMQEQSITMGLSRFSEAMTKNAEEVMNDRSPEAKATYDGMRYATTDLERAAYMSPVKVISDVARSLPSTLAMAVSVYFTRGAAARAESSALAAGLSPELARQAAIQAGAKAMGTAGAASEGALGYALGKNNAEHAAGKTSDEAMQASPRYKELLTQGFTPETARAKIVADTAEQAGQLAGIVDAAVNKVGGEILGKIITQGGKFLPRVLKGAAAEGATEMAQSAGEKAGENIAIRNNIDPSQSIAEGTGEAAVSGLVVGKVMGGTMAGVAGGAPLTPEQQIAREMESQIGASTFDADAAARAALDPNKGGIDPATTRKPANGKPLSAAVEGAAENEQRVVVTTPDGQSAAGTIKAYQEDGQGGFAAQILDDEGNLVTISDADGVQITPVAPAAGPLTAAVEDVAAQQPDAAPVAEVAPVPAAPVEPAPAAPESTMPPAEAPRQQAETKQIADMTDAELRTRLKYITGQAKNAGWDKRMTEAKREVSKEIDARNAAATQAAADAEKAAPIPTEYATQADANAGALKWAERTAQPYEVVEAGGKFTVQPAKEVSDGNDVRGSDVGGGSAGYAAGDGAAVGNGKVPSGDSGRRADGAGTGSPVGTGIPEADAGANAQPVAPVPLKNEHATQWFGSPEKAAAFIAKKKIGGTHQVEQTGRARYEIRPKVEAPKVDGRKKALDAEEKLNGLIEVANQKAAERKAAKESGAEMVETVNGPMPVADYVAMPVSARPARSGGVGSSFVAEPVAEPAAQDNNGFTDGMSAMNKGRADAALNKQQGFNGKVSDRKSEIERRVADGATVVAHPKDGRRLVSASGSFLTEKDITKTAMDYAEHLIGNASKPETSMLPQSESPAVQEFLDGKRDEAPTVAEVAAETTGKLPDAIDAMMTGAVAKQKKRILRLRTEAEKDGLSLEQKLAAQTKVKAAEATLRKMRSDIFKSEDAAKEAIGTGSITPFDEYEAIFPEAHAALAELLGKPAAGKVPDVAPEAPAAADEIDAELADALGHLGDVLGDVFGAKMNATGQQHTAGALLPALSKVIELLVKKGARTFADAIGQSAKLMRANAAIAPHMDQISARQWKAAYNAIAEYHTGTDTEEQLAAMSAEQVLAAVKAPETTVAAKPADDLRAVFEKAIKSNAMPKDNPALRKMVETFDGKPADQARLKQAQEIMEAAIAQVAREVVAKNEGNRSTFDALLRLYESQPNLNIRTSTSIANQAYSTPAPLAFLASQLAGITSKTTVIEPTAGTGLLLIGAAPQNVVANELDAFRAGLLREQGYTVTEQDASTQIPVKAPVDAVITNPPFGSIKGADGSVAKVKVDGYSLGQIDHLIAARALENMKPDGRATLIIGANKVQGGISNADLIFFNWLYSHYNVTGHFEVEGDLYQRQGAGWPVRVISINGRATSGKVSPAAGTVPRANNWSEVYEQFTNALDAGRQSVEASTQTSVRDSFVEADTGSVSKPAGTKAVGTGKPGRASGPASAGDVAGTGAGTVVDRGGKLAEPVGAATGAQRSDASPDGADRVEPAGKRPASQGAKPDGDRRATVGENQFQSTYVPRSARKDEGVLIPVNMMGPTQDGLSKLEDEVGDIDAYAAKELGYDSIDELHDAFMGLQVDSVASAIFQIKRGKGIIIADQTGIGKGRQAAAIIRWAVNNGRVPVFVTVKPSLFTDMYGDLADIGTDDVAPFIMNIEESIKGPSDEKLFANKKSTHRRNIDRIASGQLPDNTNAIFMTYSQINVPNAQRRAIMGIADNAVFILDESHNAGGESATGTFVQEVLALSKGVTYLSATYAKRPDNMPVYFMTDIGDAVADSATLMQAMASGGLPLQTVVSNNLVRAGQMFRRERSYDGVNIETRSDTGRRAEHEALSNETTMALRAIVAADKRFHEGFVMEAKIEAEKSGARVLDNAGNQAGESVNHTEFSSVVHNFVRQMLMGLKAQAAADEAIASLKRGEKPLIALENTMGSFLAEYAENNNLKAGDKLGAFDYRTVLSRALDRTRYITRQMTNGDKVKEYIELKDLDPVTRESYAEAQRVIDALNLDIPVSPLDWMRNEITKAGYSVAEITGRNLSVDYSDPKNPTLSSIDLVEQKDKVATTRRFNDGRLDAIILNVAGSTGISLHSSERFADQRQRHMIVAQAAQDINIFMQMLGRIHRTGQVNLPKYTVLNVDLPAEKRPTALLSKKMKSLNANTSSNTESATSVKSADMLNKYGDQIIGQFLADNMDLSRALGIEGPMTEQGPLEDVARKATGRLALMPVETQIAFYDEVESSYNSLMEYLNQTNQNDLEPRTFDFDAKELKQAVLFEGENPASPFGEDAIYGEYSVKAQGKAMTPTEIREGIESNLAGATAPAHTDALIEAGKADYKALVAKMEPERAAGEEQVARNTIAFMKDHPIGSAFRVEINGDIYNAIVTNVRSTHKGRGNPFSLSKIQFTIALNGALRSLSVPATQFKRIEVSGLGRAARIDDLFAVQPDNQREMAKIITGNLLAAYGELAGVKGTVISFTKEDGSQEQGILMPKIFDFTKNTVGDYRLRSGADAYKFLMEGNDPNLQRFGIATRDGVVRVTPSGSGIQIQVPKSKAKGGKYFLDAGLRAIVGDFISSGNYMNAKVDQAKAAAAIDALMRKQALYASASMAEGAKAMFAEDGPKFSVAGAALTYDEAASLIAADTELFDTIADYTADNPDAFEERPTQAAKLRAILERMKPVAPWFGTLYRGEPESSPNTDRKRGFKSWSQNERVAKEFAREYRNGVVRTRTGKMRLIDINGIFAERMRQFSSDGQYFGSEQAEWFVLDDESATANKLSVGAPAAGTTLSKDTLRNAVTDGALGPVVNSMIDAGLIVLHATGATLPRNVGSNVQGIQAVTTPDGKVHLVASGLNAKNARAVMLHEAFHQGAQKLIGTEQFDALMRRMGSLYRQGQQSTGRAKVFFDKARARVNAARVKGAVAENMTNEEFAAYAIEEYESAPATIQKWVDDLIGMVKAWAVKRFGAQLGQVTPAQLSALAKMAILDVAATRRGEVFGETGNLFSAAGPASRIDMHFKDVVKRTPELTEAANQLRDGLIDRAAYENLVNAYKPVEAYKSVPEPATNGEMRNALTEEKVPMINVPRDTLKDGHYVGLRLDIPAYRDHGTWVVSVHEGKRDGKGGQAGKAIGYQSTARVMNPNLGMAENGALKIASGAAKGTIATIGGEWSSATPQDVASIARKALQDTQWIQVGMDPERHSYFYDRATMEPVVSGSEAIQVGGLVMVKNAVYGKKDDFLFSVAGDQTGTPAFKTWFGDSKVVDAEGKPLVVYRGSVQDESAAPNVSGSNPNNRFGQALYAGSIGMATEYTNGGIPDRKDFNDKKIAEARKRFATQEEWAAFVAQNLRTAGWYEAIGAADNRGVMYPLYMSLRNPATNDTLIDGRMLKSMASDAIMNHGMGEQIKQRLIELGYDGIIFKTTYLGKPETEYVAFDPAQIKSATGNNGSFDPASPDVRYSVAADAGAAGAAEADAEILPPGFTPPPQGFLRRVQAAVQDNMNRVRQVQDTIEKVVGYKIGQVSDYYLSETNRPGRIAARLEDLQSKMLEPMVKRLAKSGYTMDQLGELLHAMHAQERNEVVARRNPEMPDGGSGMMTAAADEILERYERARELHEIADSAREIAGATLGLKHAYGLITDQTYDDLTTNYDNYVPLKGDGEYGPKIKQAIGHDERNELIMENIVRDYNQAVIVGEKNLARQSLLRMVLKFADPELWTVGVPPKGRYLAGKVFFVKRNGEKVATFASKGEVFGYIEAQGQEASQYTVEDSLGQSVAEFTRPMQDNEVMVFIKGDPIRIQIKDEKLAAQLRPLDQQQMNWVFRQAQKLNRWFSKAYTGYNPAFILRNLARDLQTGAVNMLGQYGATTAAKAFGRYPATLAALGVWAATGKVPAGQTGQYLTEYRMHGGKVGASHMADIDEQAKSLVTMFDDAKGAIAYAQEGKGGKAAMIAGRKAIRGLARVIEVANQATENALRLALYIEMRQQGKTPGIAALAAKTVTVDFDRKGSSTGALSAAYLFFNPAVQGASNGIKTLAKGKHKEQAWAAVGAFVGAGAYLAAKGMDDDEDRWLGENWSVRSKNYIMNVGEHQIRVPISQEFAPAYAFGMAVTEASRGQKKSTAAIHVMSSFLDAYFPLNIYEPSSDSPGQQFAMGLVPTVLQFPLQVAFNRNNFGSQVVPESQFTKDRPDNLKMNRATIGTPFDKTAQGIASFGEMIGYAGKYENDITKVSPETLKLMWATYTGGLGTFVTDTAGLGMMLADGEVEIGSSKIPLVKDFYRNQDVKPIRGRYYDLTRQARKAIAEFDAAKKAGDDVEIDNIMANPEKSNLIDLGRMVGNTIKAGNAMRDEAVDVNADVSLSKAEKQQKLKEIEKEEELLYRDAIQAFK